MKTREEAEKRALELFPNGEKVMEKYTSTIQREAFLQCWNEMQQNKQTCGFCVTPENEIIIHLIGQEKRDCLIAFDDWFNKNWYPEQYSILAIEAYLKTIQ